MKPELLKGKRWVNLSGVSCLRIDDAKSAVEGLIKYHEDKIELAVDILRRGYDARPSDTAYWTSVIENGYKDIMAIELWLEDAI